jgi:hypothetical protein
LSDIRKDAALANNLVKIDKIEKLEKRAAEVATQVQELEKANTAVFETVRRGGVVTSGWSDFRRRLLNMSEDK